MKKLYLCIVAVMFSSSVLASPELKGNPEELRSFLHPRERTVTLRGEAEEKAYTDKAVVSLVITTEEKQLASAMAANTDLRKTLSDTLVTKGVKADDIQNARFSSTPEYGWFGKKPDSYKVVNRMTVAVFDEKQMRAAAQLADQHKEVEISSTAFEHTQKAETEQLVRKKALDKVLEQKAFYEKSLGVSLVPVSFHEGHIGVRASKGASRVQEEVVMTAARSDAVSSMSSLQKMPAAAPSITPSATSFDELVYTAHLSVEYKILSK